MDSGGKRMSERILESILGELKGVNQRLDGIDQRLVLQEQQAAAIDSLKTEQQRYGKIIEALAVKSLEHDTDIRELKRTR
jgi:hypothetical protein